MKTRHARSATLVTALALCLGGPALANEGSKVAQSGKGNATLPSSTTAPERDVRVPNQGDTFGMNDWTQRQASQNQGRVKLDTYKGELERRWRSADKGQGLTPEEIDRNVLKSDTASSGRRALPSDTTAPERDVRTPNQGDTFGMNDWTQKHAVQSQGRVKFDRYSEEVERRWREMDKNDSGLTAAEINRIHGWEPGVATTGAGLARQPESGNAQAD